MFGGGGPLKMGGGAAVGGPNKEKIAEVKAWIKEVWVPPIFLFFLGILSPRQLPLTRRRTCLCCAVCAPVLRGRGRARRGDDDDHGAEVQARGLPTVRVRHGHHARLRGGRESKETRALQSRRAHQRHCRRGLGGAGVRGRVHAHAGRTLGRLPASTQRVESVVTHTRRRRRRHSRRVDTLNSQYNIVGLSHASDNCVILVFVTHSFHYCTYYRAVRLKVCFFFSYNGFKRLH